MDQSHDISIEELGRLQSNIATLFENVIKEKAKSDFEREKLEASLNSLLFELGNLRKENEELRKSNAYSENCESCLQLKSKLLNLNKKSEEMEKCWKLLRKFIHGVSLENMNPIHFQRSLLMLLDKLEKDRNAYQNFKQLEDMNCLENWIEKDKIWDQVYNDCNEAYKDLHSENFTAFEGKNEVNAGNAIVEGKKVTRSLFQESMSENINFHNISPCEESIISQMMKTEFTTPDKKTERSFLKAVDIMDLSAARSPRTAKEEFRPSHLFDASSSPILIDNQRVLLNRNSYIGSSPTQCKRKADEGFRSSPVKTSDKKLRLKSPSHKNHRSPARGLHAKPSPHLRTTNCLEAQISISGVKKLKQTQLNLDYYKSVFNKERDETENIEDNNSKGVIRSDESRFGEDDVILESPKNSQKSLDEFKKNSWKQEIEGSRSGRVEKIAADYEETFVNSTLLEEIEFEGNHEIENEGEGSKTDKRSPEYNSVHYPFKDEVVRKKSERMKLPGQMCMECNNYYKGVLGEIDPKRLQDILNKCSRHRDQHYNVVDTPPGYWKPYLSGTLGSTIQDEDTVLED